MYYSPHLLIQRYLGIHLYTIYIHKPTLWIKYIISMEGYIFLWIFSLLIYYISYIKVYPWIHTITNACVCTYILYAIHTCNLLKKPVRIALFLSICMCMYKYIYIYIYMNRYILKNICIYTQGDWKATYYLKILMIHFFTIILKRNEFERILK